MRLERIRLLTVRLAARPSFVQDWASPIAFMDWLSATTNA